MPTYLINPIAKELLRMAGASSAAPWLNFFVDVPRPFLGL